MKMLKISLLALSCALMLQMAQTKTSYKIQVQQCVCEFKNHVNKAISGKQLLPAIIKLNPEASALLSNLSTFSLSDYSEPVTDVRTQHGNQLAMRFETSGRYVNPNLSSSPLLNFALEIFVILTIKVATNRSIMDAVQFEKTQKEDNLVVRPTVNIKTVEGSIALKRLTKAVAPLIAKDVKSDITSLMVSIISTFTRSVNNALAASYNRQQNRKIGDIGTYHNKVVKLNTDTVAIEYIVESQVVKPDGTYINFPQNVQMPALPDPTNNTEYATAVSQDAINALLENSKIPSFEIDLEVGSLTNLSKVNKVFKDAVKLLVAPKGHIQVTVKNESITGTLEGAIIISDVHNISIVSFRGSLHFFGNASIERGCLNLHLKVEGLGALTVDKKHEDTVLVESDLLKDELLGILKDKVQFKACIMAIPEPLPAPKDIDEANVTPKEGHILIRKEKNDGAVPE